MGVSAWLSIDVFGKYKCRWFLFWWRQNLWLCSGNKDVHQVSSWKHWLHQRDSERMEHDTSRYSDNVQSRLQCGCDGLQHHARRDVAWSSDLVKLRRRFGRRPHHVLLETKSVQFVVDLFAKSLPKFSGQCDNDNQLLRSIPGVQPDPWCQFNGLLPGHNHGVGPQLRPDWFRCELWSWSQLEFKLYSVQAAKPTKFFISRPERLCASCLSTENCCQISQSRS